MHENSWLEIDLGALDHNVQCWRGLLGSTPVPQDGERAGRLGWDLADRMGGERGLSAGTASGGTRLGAVVKADAYSLGAVAIARQLEASGVDMLCVYNAKQADELFAAGIDAPVLVLQSMHDLPGTGSFTAAAAAGRLHLGVDHPDQLRMAHRLGKGLDRPIRVHLHLDTGMCRAGMNAEQFSRALFQVRGLSHLRVAGVFTHFATQREDVAQVDSQLAKFDAVMAKHAHLLPADAVTHVASTYASLRDAKYRRDMVRVGLGLYGYAPAVIDERPTLPTNLTMKPVVRWLGRIVHLQRYAKGTPVGYGFSHTLDRDSLIGVVPAGYGDGYPLALSNKSHVQVLEHTGGRVGHPTALARVIGRVSMDQITIDLTDAERKGLIEIGTHVELVSNAPDSPASLQKLAEQSGASCYELLCRLSPRLPRHYLNGTPQRQTTGGAARAGRLAPTGA